MQIVTDRPQALTAICADLGAIFVSLELSRSTWLIASLSPGGREKMSEHTVRSGDVAGLWMWFSQLKDKVQVRIGQVVPIIVIHEAGLDGFWIHRWLQDEGVESHVVDPASIATSRRRRRAKTDKIDGEALVRAPLAYKRGEPRACAIVRAPTPYEEDRRRICRERKTLTAERVEHVNRIMGLLFAQGISDYEPSLRKIRARLEKLRTGDGRPLPKQLKAQIGRKLDRLELTLEQIKSVETERDAMLSLSDEGTPAPGNVKEFEGDWSGIRRCPVPVHLILCDLPPPLSVLQNLAIFVDGPVRVTLNCCPFARARQALILASCDADRPARPAERRCCWPMSTSRFSGIRRFEADDGARTICEGY